MKIAIIHIRYIYKGGLETRLFNYINYFLENGDDVHLYTSKVAPDIIPPKGLKIHFVDLKVIPKPIRNFFFDKRLKKILNRSEYDFILSLERTSRQNHVIAPSTHKGYLDAKGDVLYDLIDMIQIYLDKKAFRNAKVIYACSLMVKEEIERFYQIPPNRIKVLYPPVNLTKFKVGNKKVAKEKWQLDNNKLYFLFVSTSHKRKGLDLLLKVFNKLPEKYQLLVAGTEFHNESKNIKGLGFVKDIANLYQAVDALIHPAIYEPFGQIITEAFATHTPVIVSHKVGAKELITPNRGLIINNFNPKDWQNAILSFDIRQFNFDDIDTILQDISLEIHMKKMLNWAMLKK